MLSISYLQIIAPLRLTESPLSQPEANRSYSPQLQAGKELQCAFGEDLWWQKLKKKVAVFTF